MMRSIGLACVGLLAAAGVAQAEWPKDREITMIVGYSAGGGTDVLARTLAPFIEKHLEGDASIVVVNRPGPGGEYGFTELANATPDGYTIGFLNAPGYITLPYERQTRYDFDSFIPVANIVTDPATLSVPPKSEFQNLDELVEFAKANPGAATIGTQGVGSAMHISLEQFLDKAGIEVTMVPFPGGAANRTAVMGGHITGGMTGAGEAAVAATDGNVRALGVMSRERSEFLPDTPTFAEQGYEVYSGSDRGLGAPAGTPQEIVDKLSEAVRKAVEDPEFREKAKEQFLPLNYMNSAEYRAHLSELNEEIANLWKTKPWK